MLLKMRSGIDIPKDAMICLHHEKIFLEKYEHFQKNCIDPYGCHKKTHKKVFVYCRYRHGLSYKGYGLCKCEARDEVMLKMLSRYTGYGTLQPCNF